MSVRVKYTLGDLPIEAVRVNVWSQNVSATKYPQTLGHRYTPLLRKRKWLNFLQAEWEVYDDPEERYVTTHAWASHLVLDNLVPLLERTGYTLKVTKQEFVDCMLNYMFRHEENFAKALPTTYMCKHCRRMNSDQAEFFHQRKLPVGVWQQLQRRLAIEHWSDGEEFADRFWLDLPHIVFVHCDMEKSRATEELEELLRADDDTEEDVGKRREVDPYLADYYGAKYKEKETSESGGS
jgi:hypothetical protein